MSDVFSAAADPAAPVVDENGNPVAPASVLAADPQPLDANGNPVPVPVFAQQPSSASETQQPEVVAEVAEPRSLVDATRDLVALIEAHRTVGDSDVQAAIADIKADPDVIAAQEAEDKAAADAAAQAAADAAQAEATAQAERDAQAVLAAQVSLEAQALVDAQNKVADDEAQTTRDEQAERDAEAAAAATP